jgi:hypothetical protein
MPFERHAVKDFLSRARYDHGRHDSGFSISLVTPTKVGVQLWAVVKGIKLDSGVRRNDDERAHSSE